MLILNYDRFLYDKEESMKKTILTVVVLLILAVSIFAVSCSEAKGGTRKSDTVISVSDNMTFDEKEWVDYLAEEKSICLAKDGITEYKIVIPFSEKDILEEDAVCLAEILRRMTGSLDGFEVITDGEFYAGKFISIGNTAYASDITADGVIYDGFTIKSTEENIYIKSSDEVDPATAKD